MFLNVCDVTECSGVSTCRMERYYCVITSPVYVQRIRPFAACVAQQGLASAQCNRAGPRVERRSVTFHSQRGLTSPPAGPLHSPSRHTVRIESSCLAPTPLSLLRLPWFVVPDRGSLLRPSLTIRTGKRYSVLRNTEFIVPDSEWPRTFFS